MSFCYLSLFFDASMILRSGDYILCLLRLALCLVPEQDTYDTMYQVPGSPRRACCALVSLIIPCVLVP
jgi:hypothetical protein